jgi:sugar lactone lactonase YvrE
MNKLYRTLMGGSGVLLMLALASPLRGQSVEVVLDEGIHEPFSVDFDAEGNLIGVEFIGANRVFKLDENGALRFIAGVEGKTNSKGGDVGADDGADPLKAHFNGMHDLAIASNGDIYLADTFNFRLRKIDAESGELSTVMGTGEKGFSGDGGAAVEAEHSGVHAISFNADGSRLYFTDLSNRRIRMMDMASGTVVTVAGTGERGVPEDGMRAKRAPLPGPRAVAVDGDENIYIVSREGNALRVVGADGKIRTVVNVPGKKGYSGDGGVDAREGMLNGPKHACIDDEGNVLIADTENHVIRKYVPGEGRIYLVAGVPGKKGAGLGAGPLDTELNRPHGVRVHEGWLYIADSGNDRVLRVAAGAW